MTKKHERPRFLSSYFKSIGQGVDRRGWRAVFPAWVLLCASIGALCSYAVPAAFWVNARLDVSTAVYLGILMLNGLIMALSWGAFARIHDSLSAPKFGPYLMEKELMNGYIVYIDYIHIAQVVAILASATGLIILLCDFERSIFNQIAFATMIGASIYAVKCAVSAVTAMHDLIWQKAIFEQTMADDSNGDKVIKMRKD